MQENQSMDISRFMQRIHEYTKITELSVEIVNELIDRIIIHKPEGNKRNRILKIEIHYNFIGDLDKKKEAGQKLASHNKKTSSSN